MARANAGPFAVNETAPAPVSLPDAAPSQIVIWKVNTMHGVNTTLAPREVRIPVGDTSLYGDSVMAPGFKGLVLVAHGSGSGRQSVRSWQVAQHLQDVGIATRLFKLLTAQEEQVDLHTREHRFNNPSLTRRMQNATARAAAQAVWQQAATGYFSASTGSAAARIAAARLGHRIAALSGFQRSLTKPAQWSR